MITIKQLTSKTLNLSNRAMLILRPLGLFLIAVFPAFGFLIEHVSSGLWYGFLLLGLIATCFRYRDWRPLTNHKAVAIGLAAAIGYVLLSATSIWLIDNSEMSVSRLERHLLLLITPAFLVFLFAIQPTCKFILRSFAFGAMAMGLYSLWYRLSGQGIRIDAVTHAIHFANAALLLAALSPLPLIYEKRTSPWLWAWCLSGLSLGCLAVLWSLSRGAWIAALVIIIVMAIVLAIRNIRNHKATASGAIALIFILAFVLQLDSVQNRIRETAKDFERQQSGEIYTSIGIRFILWENAWNIFKSAPLIGAGYSSHADRLEQSIKQGDLKPSMQRFTSEPHNQYLFELAAKGLLGLASYLLFLAYPLIILRRHIIHGDHRALAIGLAGLMVFLVYAVSGMTITLFDQRRMIHLFGFMYAIILYLYQHKESIQTT